MIYIVTWFLFTIAPCPSPPPDEFGRQSMIRSDVLCIDSTKHTKKFDNLDSALAFIARGEKLIGVNAPFGFKLDSMFTIPRDTTGWIVIPKRWKRK